MNEWIRGTFEIEVLKIIFKNQRKDLKQIKKKEKNLSLRLRKRLC